MGVQTPTHKAFGRLGIYVCIVHDLFTCMCVSVCLYVCFVYILKDVILKISTDV